MWTFEEFSVNKNAQVYAQNKDLWSGYDEFQLSKLKIYTFLLHNAM